MYRIRIMDRIKRTAVMFTALLLAVSMMPAVPDLPGGTGVQTAYADDGKVRQMRMGAEGLQKKDQIYFGDLSAAYQGRKYAGFKGGPMHWRVLDPVKDNCGKEGAVFMITEELVGDMDDKGKRHSLRYNPNGASNAYHSSYMPEWCAGFRRNAFTDAEQKAMRCISKQDGSEYFGDYSGVVLYNDGSGHWDYYTAKKGLYTKEDRIDDQYIFLPSFMEVKDYIGTSLSAVRSYINGSKACWWTRSPLDKNYVAMCYGGTQTKNHPNKTYPGFHREDGKYDEYVRPVTNLEHKAIAFISTAGMKDKAGKPGPDAMIEVPVAERASEYEVTLFDSTRDGFMFDTKLDGNILTIKLGIGEDDPGVRTGKNEYVSAVVLTKDDEIKWYGRIGDCEKEAPEEVKINGIRDKVNEEAGDRLYLFSEQYNGKEKAAFCSHFTYIDFQNEYYTVVYVMNGRGEPYPGTFEVHRNTVLDRPQDPEEPGWKFEGWYTDEELTEEYDFSSRVTGPLVLYAKWTPHKYRVYYMSGPGEDAHGVAAEDRTVDDYKPLRPVSEIAKPPSEGALFTGWISSPGGAQFDDMTTRTLIKPDNDDETVYLYPHWTEVFTVKFDVQGRGDTPPDAKATAESEWLVDKPEVLGAGHGYVIEGWYTCPECTTDSYWNFGSDPVYEDMTLYAHWVKNGPYTIKYDPGRGSGRMEDQTRVIGDGQKLRKCTFEKPQSDEYAMFAGWNTREDGLGRSYPDESTEDIFPGESGVVTLYAQWDETRVVFFDLNGRGDAQPEPQTSGYLGDSYYIEKPSPEPKETGYDLAGWYTEPECVNEWDFYSDKLSKKVTTLYAKWVARDYMVTYEANPQGDGAPYVVVSGEMPVDYRTAGDGKKLTKNAYSLEWPSVPLAKYYFTGWNTMPDGHGDGYEDESRAVMDDFGLHRVVLYAQWNDPVIITNSLPVGRVGEPYSVQLEQRGVQLNECWGEAYSDETGPILPGIGLSIASSTGILSGTPSQAGTYKVMISVTGRNTDPYGPLWIMTYKEMDLVILQDDPSDGYYVVFDTQGHGKEPAPEMTGREKGWKVKEPDLHEAGDYTLEGWYTKPGCTEDSRWDFENDTVKKNMVLYAKWKGHPYTINFDPGRGRMLGDQGLMEPQQRNVGDGKALPACRYSPPFLSNGAEFIGWNTEKDGSGTSYEDRSTEDVASGGEVTLYAQWSSSGLVLFRMNGHGGSAPSPQIVSSKQGYKVNVPEPDPEAKGYSFTGWYKDAGCDNEWDFDKDRLTKKLTQLYAGWEAVMYTVRFDANGGTGVMTPVCRSYDDGKALPENEFVRIDPEGVKTWQFSGWNSEKDGSGRGYEDKDTDNISDKAGDDVTLYAQWNGIWIRNNKLKDGTIGEEYSDQLRQSGLEEGTVTWSVTGGDLPEGISVSPDGKLSGIPEQAGNYSVTVQAKGMSEGSEVTIAKTLGMAVIQKDPDIEYFVAYDVQGIGKAPEPATVGEKDGWKLTRPEDPAADGFVFGGWYTDPSCDDDTAWDFDDTVASDMILYAKWTGGPGTRTVIFDLNGHGSPGPVPQAVKEEQGWHAAEPDPEPSEDGYTLTGWYREPGCLSRWDFEKDSLTEDMTRLYAGWKANRFTISFDANAPEGTKVSGTIMEPQQRQFGDGKSLPENSFRVSDPADEGASFTFAGWNTEADGSGDAYEDGDKSDIAAGDGAELKLYAQWRTARITTAGLPEARIGEQYGVRLEQDGLAGDSVKWSLGGGELPDGLTVTQSGMITGTPSQAGTYEITVKADGKQAGTGVRLSITKKFTLGVSQDEPSKVYYVFFDTQGHGTAPAAQIAGEPDDWKVKEPEDPQEDGYVFAGWFTDKKCSAGSRWDFNDSVSKNMKLYAGWKTDGGAARVVTFDLNGHGGPKPAPQVRGEHQGWLVREPEAPEADGYDFTGWYKEAECVSKWDFGRDTLTEKRTVLYAGWDAHSYSVSFEANAPKEAEVSGSMDPQSRVFDDGKALPANSFSLKDPDDESRAFVFTGWNTKDDGSGDAFGDRDSQNITAADEADVTLYAQWNMAQITTSRLPDGRTGADYAARLTQAGLTDAVWSIKEGELPEGLTMKDDGRIYGTPEQAGSFGFMASVTGINLMGDSETLEKKLSIFIVQDDPDELVIVFTEGMDGVWVRGDAADLAFRTNGPFGMFESLDVDGAVLVKDRDYTAASGSTVIKLKPEYLKSLTDGSHVLTAHYSDGQEPFAKFSVRSEPEPPKPDDDEKDKPKPDNGDNIKPSPDNDGDSAPDRNYGRRGARTGDETHVALWAVTLVMALLLIAVQAVRSKRRRK